MTETARGGIPLSVMIPTRNEERNIAACIDSVAWADDIVVFDSYSDDATLDIARARGARVVQREFDSFSTHKNWGLDTIDFRHPWVLMLDADERITPPLRDEIAQAIRRNDGPVGYYVARQTFFMGKWMRHVGIWPDYNMRLLRRGHGRYEDRVVHEHVILDGPAGYLKNHLVHEDDKGIERYLDRHNHYTSLEAVEIFRSRAAPSGDRLTPNLLARGPQRRRALKSFAYRFLPGRPAFVFLYMYGWKGGFLDGRVGLRYCLLRAFHEYHISVKLIELADPNSAMRQKYRRFIER